MENTHRRPSGKRPKKRRFRGNQFMKVCPHTYVAEKRDTKINRRSILAMRCIGQGLESLKTFCAVMSLPNTVEQKSYDAINNKLSRVMKEVAEESMKRAAVEENSSSPDNLLTKNKLSDGKTIGGKGRLTDNLDDKLAHYYGNAIRCNSTSVKEMRKAIWAV
ncbi:uncharacterized protein TNCV_5068631 [Trichonephila clavipes]|nr:uncharacterized protein TNCV_5068631 [Trichonephila clavipes]